MTRPEVEAWAEHPDLVEFYESHRNTPDDLYPSERRFLPWLARDSESVLDVGCAAGGFADIWRAYNPDVRYTGVDASHGLVEAAARIHPDLEFHHGDCAEGLPLPDAAADTVQALGWLHWEGRHEAALAELWRLAERFLFFDVRLQDENKEDQTAEQRLALSHDWDGHTTVPYIVHAWPTFANLLLSLQPTRVLATGYLGKPSDTVVGMQGSICFATFVLERAGSGPAEVCLDLPLALPAELGGEVTVLPPEELARLAPAEGVIG
jgi:trans-aconitate methyltransferase